MKKEEDEEPMDDVTIYPVKFTWDRAGESVDTLEFHSKEERNAYIEGVAEGSGWDCPDWVILPKAKVRMTRSQQLSRKGERHDG
jgi:hypothetical protein